MTEQNKGLPPRLTKIEAFKLVERHACSFSGGHQKTWLKLHSLWHDHFVLDWDRMASLFTAVHQWAVP